MCWYSAERTQVLQAEAGQRIVTRRMHGSTNWMIRECDATALQPTAVCLLDGTEVMLRPSEDEQAQLNVSSEPRVVFRMLTHPKRDVLVLPNGRELAIDSLPAGMVLDVLVVPGSEKLSAVLKAQQTKTADVPLDISDETDAEPALVDRVRRFFF
jgi:hypothetical protein